MGLLDKIKADAQKSGSSRSKFFYVKDGDKKRVRFLTEADDGFEVVFHDSYEANINVPCQEIFGRDCPYCDEEGLRTRSQYVWYVWDYDAAEVKIFMYPMNNCSPIGAVIAAYETYGSLLDRDFMIQRTGKQQNTQYSVMPMDKNQFKNKKAKPLSESAFLEILEQAYPDELSKKYENDGKMKTKSKAAKANKRVADDDDDDEEELPFTTLAVDDDDDEDEVDYSEMSAKELYKLCKERKIDVEPKKSEKYYIRLLEEADKAEDDWEDDDDDEDDDWD